MVKFRCVCGHMQSIPEEYAGKTGRCSQCGQRYKIPADLTAALKKAASSAKSAVQAADRKDEAYRELEARLLADLKFQEKRTYDWAACGTIATALMGLFFGALIGSGYGQVFLGALIGAVTGGAFFWIYKFFKFRTGQALLFI